MGSSPVWESESCLRHHPQVPGTGPELVRQKGTGALQICTAETMESAESSCIPDPGHNPHKDQEKGTPTTVAQPAYRSLLLGTGLPMEMPAVRAVQRL